MPRSALPQTSLLVCAVACLLLLAPIDMAHAGGWSLKKACKGVRDRVKKEAGRLDKKLEKQADRIADEGRRFAKSKVVVKARTTVKEVGSCVAQQARKGARVVEKAVCAIPKRLSWGYRDTQRRVEAPVKKVTSVVSDTCAPWEQPDPC